MKSTSHCVFFPSLDQYSDFWLCEYSEADLCSWILIQLLLLIDPVLNAGYVITSGTTGLS